MWTIFSRAGVKILVIDEAQFASVSQIDELAQLVDDHDVDVHAFGLSSDFLLNVFPASARLFAIADWAHELPLTSSCWCGKKGRCNARVVDGVVAREGIAVRHGRRRRGGGALSSALSHPLPTRPTQRSGGRLLRHRGNECSIFVPVNERFRDSLARAECNDVARDTRYARRSSPRSARSARARGRSSKSVRTAASSLAPSTRTFVAPAAAGATAAVD